MLFFILVTAKAGWKGFAELEVAAAVEDVTAAEDDMKREEDMVW